MCKCAESGPACCVWEPGHNNRSRGGGTPDSGLTNETHPGTMLKYWASQVLFSAKVAGGLQQERGCPRKGNRAKRWGMMDA